MPPRKDVTATRRREPKWFETTRTNLMTVAICIIVLALNGIVNPPGGRYSDDLSKFPNCKILKYQHHFGQPVMSIQRPRLYPIYTGACSLLFVLSWIIIVVLITGFPRWSVIVLLVIFMFITMIVMPYVFYSHLLSCLPPPGDIKSILKTMTIVYFLLCAVAAVFAVWFLCSLIWEPDEKENEHKD